MTIRILSTCNHFRFIVVVCAALVPWESTSADDQQDFYKSYPACYRQSKKSAWAEAWSEADIVRFCTGTTLKQMTFGVDTFAFDGTSRKRTVYLDEINEAEEEHDTWLLDPVKELYDTSLFFPRRASNLGNAFATITGGYRYILSDPLWLKDPNGRQIVLFHEVGHHACGHTEGVMRQNPWQRELEADRFAGAAARKAGMTLAAVHAAAARLLAIEPSSTHPGLAMRLQALTMGYNSGSPCTR